MSEKKKTGDELFGFTPEVTPPAAPAAPEPRSQQPDPPAPPAPEPPAPPATPPAPVEPPAPPVFDFVTHFGDKYKSADDVKQVLSQYDQISQENLSLKQAVEQVQNPFVNDTVYKYNALVKKGMDPKLAYRMANLSSESIAQTPAHEVIALLEMTEVPEMLTMEADLREEIQFRYDTKILSEDDGYSPEQVEDSKRRAKRNELLLAKDAAKAREKLLEASKVDPMEVKDPVVSLQEKQQKTEQLSAQWGEITPKLVTEKLQEIPIYKEVFNEETKKLEYVELTKFKVSEDRLKGLDQELKQLAVAQNIPLTEDGLRSLYSQAYASILAKNHAAIVSAVIASVSGSAQQQAEQQFFRPTDPTRPAAQRPVGLNENLTKEERITKQGDEMFPERSGRR